MKVVVFIVSLFVSVQAIFSQAPKEYIVFFETPLVCDAKATIGCGSRAKPLLLAFEATEYVSEAWLNREGTYVALVLKEPYLPLRQLLKKTKSVFDEHGIEYKTVNNAKQHTELRAHFREHGLWYRGASVDSLSWEEAIALADHLITYLEVDVLAPERIASLRQEIIYCIGQELTGQSEGDVQARLAAICENYVGKESVQRSIERYNADQSQVQMYTSTITCPHCKHRKAETLPADRCIMEYTCENCKTVIKHKKGDCCVFCSYGDVKCPTAE